MLLALIVLLLFAGFVASWYAQHYAPKKQPSIQETQSYPLVFIGKAVKIKQPVKAYNENKGRSEAFFHRYLQKFFPKQVYTDLALPVGNSYYYPDFAIISKEHNLYVDIEIDEPYNFRGYPTHTKGADDRRNAYFVQCGWAVIRFTEEQIARQPLQCCKFIAQTLYRISRDSSFLKNDLSAIPDLSFTPKIWDEQMARQMALNASRDNYAKVFQ
jgi:hypothetical protein